LRLDFVDRGIQTIKFGNRIGVKCNTLIARLTDRSGFGAHIATRNLIRKIDAYNPDVIHLHNLHGDYINIEILFSYFSKLNKPIIWSTHDCWSITGHCAHFVQTDCMKWKDGCSHCPQKSSYPKSYFFDQSKRNYRDKKKLFTNIKNLTIVTASQWLADIMQKSFLQQCPLKVISNGIDLSVFKPTKGNFRELYHIGHKKIILSVASAWSLRKGLNDFINLASRLDSTKQIVLVGLNDKQLKLIPDTIIGIKRTSNINELAEIYACANVFVNLTYEDTFGMVNVEAQACGTPVITYRTGGTPETITGKTGIVVEQGNLEEVEKAITSLLSSEFDYQSECVRNAQINYDKSDRFEDYIQLYRDILKKR
jgi:putative colanic acid biosynthesis glycosyltransferase